MSTKRKKSGRARSTEAAIAPSEFDEEFVVDSFKAPSAEERKRWERAKRKPGRPREGRGAKVISVSVEKSLLEQSDRLAKAKGITRAKLIARGLRAVLAAEGIGSGQD